MASYSLTVVNNSELASPFFALFADLPVVSENDAFPLAWLVQEVDRGDRYVFGWEMDWGFVASQGAVREGYLWTPSLQLSADPLSDGGCAATLDYDRGFTLAPASRAGVADGSGLWITGTPEVPKPDSDPISVGVSLNGAPAMVVDAGPNLVQAFTLHPTYAIDAGDYVAGQMVDGESVRAFQTLEFQGGIRSLTATLNADATWTVGATSEPTPPS